jgi:hypothetical protein
MNFRLKIFDSTYRQFHNTALPCKLHSGKGHEFALESFNLISKKYPDWKLRFVGGDMGYKRIRISNNTLIAARK